MPKMPLREVYEIIQNDEYDFITEEVARQGLEWKCSQMDKEIDDLMSRRYTPDEILARLNGTSEELRLEQFDLMDCDSLDLQRAFDDFFEKAFEESRQNPEFKVMLNSIFESHGLAPIPSY